MTLRPHGEYNTHHVEGRQRIVSVTLVTDGNPTLLDYHENNYFTEPTTLFRVPGNRLFGP